MGVYNNSHSDIMTNIVRSIFALLLQYSQVFDKIHTYYFYLLDTWSGLTHPLQRRYDVTIWCIYQRLTYLFLSPFYVT